MQDDIFLVSYLDGLRPVWATVSAASPMQALRVVQRSVLAQGREPLTLVVELICPGALLAAQA